MRIRRDVCVREDASDPEPRHAGEARAAAIERLIEITTNREEVIDWNTIDRVDELAWGYQPEERTASTLSKPRTL
jgi:hypothetical protein